MEQPVALGIVLVCGIAALALLGLMGYALSGGGQYPACWRCKVPLVNGFEASEGPGQHTCRSCCREHGIRPWYWKDVLGPWPGKE